MLVSAPRADIARAWGALVPLQPVAWRDDGLVCCPRAADGDASGHLARCPLPVRVLDRVPAWPPAPCAWIAGRYHRTPAHAPAPGGVHELVVVPGEGFGTAPHATTGLVLRTLDALPPAPAWDLGCGAGLLTQGWAARGLPVDAADIDAAAVHQARASADAAGCGDLVTWHRAPVEAIAPDVTGRVVLANLPPVAHAAIAPHVRGRPLALVASGMRARDVAVVRAHYAHLGLRPVRMLAAGAWRCLVLAPREA